MKPARNRPKFILIDSSISGSGGHYLEYAEQVFAAADAAGFACALVANAAFLPAPGFEVPTFAVLPFDMWGNNLALRHDRENTFTEDDRRSIRQRFSRLGVLWAAAGNLAAVEQYSREVPLAKATARRLAAIAEVQPRIERMSRAILAHRSTAQVPRSHAAARRQRDQALREAIRRAARGPGIEDAGEDRAAEISRLGAAAFAYAEAVGGALRKIGIGPDDIVFVPTLSFAEAAAVRDLIARSAVARLPTWCLLFRRDVYRGYAADWETQEWQAHAVRTLFASFVDLAPRARIKLLCDTDELCRQYDRFQAGQFTLAAIPVRTGAAALAASPIEDASPPAGGRIEILFRRDPRWEHGVDYLPQVLDALPPDLLPRLRLSASPAASALPPEMAEKDNLASELARARLRPYRTDCYREFAEPQRLDAWRTVMRLFHIAVFVEPRNVRPSLLIDELQAAALAGTIIVLPADTVLAGFANSLVRQHPNTRIFTYGEGASSAATAKNLAESVIAAVQLLVERPPSADEAPPPWLLCYPGDAREEKGFALLPEIVDKLALQVIAGRPVRLAAQAYQTAGTFDVAILKAVDRLQRAAADGNVVIGKPLAPPAYNALIAGSDIVYNLYRRENYTARSSGVFVEAIAARKPAIVTGGTWMSALMGAYAPDYHRDTIGPDAVVSEVTLSGSDIRWREIGLADGQHVDREISIGDTPQLTETLGVYHVFTRPDEANHAWIELEVDSLYPDVCIRLNCTGRRPNLSAVREERFVLNRLGSGPLSVVLEVPRSCEDLWIGFNTAHTDVAVQLRWVRVSWVDVGAVAFLPGGASVGEGEADYMVEQTATAITTILANYEAYRNSCEWLARQWADAQNAAELVNGIVAAPALEYRPRFAGRDW